MKKVFAVLLALLLVFGLVACGGGSDPDPTPAPAAPAAPGNEENEDEGGAELSGDTLYIGVVAPMSGPTVLVGTYQMQGATLAMEMINAEGGILGRPVELIFSDEVDNLQDSVNATNWLLANDDLTAIVGSMFSQYNLAVMPRVLEEEIPYFASGSSSGVSNEGNPFTWQVRPIDTFQGLALANFAIEELGVQNPAILHSTQSTFASLAEQTVEAFRSLGVEITDTNMFGFPEEETNYVPYFAQVLDGDFDAIIAMANQMPAALMMQQAQLAGVDPHEIPLIGSTSFGSNVAITNAEAAADYWYSIADWVPGGSTPAGHAFEEAFVARFGEPSDLPAAAAFDAIMLIRHAAELAGSTDRIAINDALSQVSNFPGVISYFSSFPDHVFATALSVTRNIDQQMTLIQGIQFRQP